jgi:hypothetical protein
MAGHAHAPHLVGPPASASIDLFLCMLSVFPIIVRMCSKRRGLACNL